MADVWLVLTGPLLPLPFQTILLSRFSSRLGGHSWPRAELLLAHQLTHSLLLLSASPVTGCVSLCPAALQLPSFMHLLQIDWTTAARSWWACLDWVLRCAARLIGCMPKYGSVSAYMRDTLHWLPIAQRISYTITIWRCLLGSAPGYLCELLVVPLVVPLVPSW